MKAMIEPGSYNHVVLAAENAEKACENWGYVFQKDPPQLNRIKDGWHFMQPLMDASEYRHQAWVPTFTQPVFESDHTFFEIDGAGERDYFHDFLEANGSGICYMGFWLDRIRHPFVKRLQEEFDCDVVTYQKLHTDAFSSDWAVVETNRILGCDLCIKEFDPGSHNSHPFISDFREFLLRVPNLPRAEAMWRELFHIEEQDIQRGTTEDGLSAVRINSLTIPVTMLEVPEAHPLSRFSGKRGHGIMAAVLPENIETNASTRLEEISGQPLRLTLFEQHYDIYSAAQAMAANLAIMHKN